MALAVGYCLLASADASRSVRYRQLLKTSRDYWTLAHDVLWPAAKSGDADAQFYLARLLRRCSGDNAMLFQRRGRLLTLSDANHLAEAIGLPADYAQTAYDRCHRFLTQDTADLGVASTWLAAATDGRQPAAQAETAMSLLLQERMSQLRRAEQFPDPYTEIPASNPQSPRALFRESLLTGDPEVLFAISDSQLLLGTPETYSDVKRFAWFLLACRSGFDCTASSDWAVLNGCRGPLAEKCAAVKGPEDLVRILSDDLWPQVQQTAQILQAALAARDWNTLGLADQ